MRGVLLLVRLALLPQGVLRLGQGRVLFGECLMSGGILRLELGLLAIECFAFGGQLHLQRGQLGLALDVLGLLPFARGCQPPAFLVPDAGTPVVFVGPLFQLARMSGRPLRVLLLRLLAEGLQLRSHRANRVDQLPRPLSLQSSPLAANGCVGNRSWFCRRRCEGLFDLGRVQHFERDRSHLQPVAGNQRGVDEGMAIETRAGVAIARDVAPCAPQHQALNGPHSCSPQP